MANTAISGLTASAADLAATDILPVVQTTGVGPVKMTGQQLAGGLLGSTTLSGATVTADAPVLDLEQTWNNGGVTFTGLKFSATDTASTAASLLMAMQVGTSRRFEIDKSGGVRGFAFSGWTGGSIFTGTQWFYAISNSVNISSTSRFAFVNNSNAGVTTVRDTILTRRGPANLRLGDADTGAANATVTITIAAPGVVTWTAHNLSAGTPVVFTTTGALPTGITAGTTYYAVPVNENTFQIASSVANAIAATPTVITTSGTQSGTHTGTRYAIAQTLSVQGSTGTSNTAGANLTITGSQGTGTGAGGSIVFQVAPAGSSGTAQNALATALTINSSKQLISDLYNTTTPALAPAGSTDTGIVFSGSNGSLIMIYRSGSAVAAINQNGVNIGSGYQFSWAASSNATGTGDTILARDAANTLALRNSTNAQEFRVYNTFTSSTNFERFRIFAQSGGSVIIGTEKGSAGGTAQALELQTDGTTRLTIAATTNTITLPANSNLNCGSDSVVRLRYINSSNNAITFFDFYNTSGFATFANATTNPRMNFGGTTSSFPALKRSSASLIVRLADDSANAALESASVKTDAPAGGTSGTWKLGVAATVSPTSPNRTIEVDIGGTIYYIAAKTTND